MDNLFGENAQKELFDLLAKHKAENEEVTIMLRDRSFGDSVTGIIKEYTNHFVIVYSNSSNTIKAIIPWQMIEHLRYRNQ